MSSAVAHNVAHVVVTSSPELIKLARWTAWMKARTTVVTAAQAFCAEPWSIRLLNRLHKAVDEMNNTPEP